MLNPSAWPSRGEALDQPAVLVPPVAQPIVEPTAPTLPELDRFRRKSPAAPVRGQGNFATGIFLLEHFHAVFEHAASGNDRALLRHPGGELAGPWARVKVRFTDLARYLGN